MSTMEARAYLINLIDEMLIARANKIADESRVKK
jgi:hypothetical protein